MNRSVRIAFRDRPLSQTLALLWLPLVVAGSLVYFAAGAEAKPSHDAVRVSLKILTANQTTALDARSVRVRVRSTGRAVVRLTGPRVKTKKVRFHRARRTTRVVKVWIRDASWDALATCGIKPIGVTGRYRYSIRKRTIRRRDGRRVVGHRTVKRQAKTKTKRRLNADRVICEKPPTCDPTGEGACLLPWPNDYYTRPDADTPTGIRLDLGDEMMPRNRKGKPIEAAAWNESDGFSIGQPILVRVPGLDNPAALTATDPASIARIEDYLYPEAPVVLIEAATGERVPIWVELDSTAASDAGRLIEIHPARSLKPATRYIVAMRDLSDASGAVIPAGAAFRGFRDRKRVAADPEGKRRARYERIFRELARAGIGRSNLNLAWDFTVASDENLSGRLLSMRDQAFAALGDTDLGDRIVAGSPPSFTVDQVKSFTLGQNPRIAREVRGTITVPCFLWPSCDMETGPDPGGRFHLDSDGLPEENQTNPMAAKYTCTVPRVAETTPGRPSLYGHGLFSDLDEVTIRPHQNLAQNHDMVLCATDQIGLTAAEQPHVIGIVSDFSRFPEIADALQQGMLNELMLGRAMIHPDGFSSNPAFRSGNDVNGEPVIAAGTRLSYSGYSMGGIMGSMLTAVAPDLDRAVLGVPGMRFSLLLPRSSYWSVFGLLIKSAYPKDIDATIAVSLLQNLWDRGEGNGYAHRLTDPLPNTPPHKVLLSAAFGDHQVSNWSTLVLARTVGAAVRTPILDSGRWTPGAMWGIPPINSWPHAGAAMTMWDIGPLRGDPAVGVPAPPLTNTPNLAGEDPHSMIWDLSAERAEVAQFLDSDAGFTDPCPTGTPCYGGSWSGPSGP